MRRPKTLLVIVALGACFCAGGAFSPSPARRNSHDPFTSTRWTNRAVLRETKEGGIDTSPQQEETNLFSKFLSNLRTASSDGFGTKARNVGSTMKAGDVVVPLCSNLDKRQSLAQIGLYAGVEYLICDIQEGSGEEGQRLISERVATLKPAYPLRPHLERSDWPITLPVSEVPLW